MSSEVVDVFWVSSKCSNSVDVLYRVGVVGFLNLFGYLVMFLNYFVKFIVFKILI